MKRRTEPTSRRRTFIRRLSAALRSGRPRREVDAQVAAELAIIAEHRTAA
jgi:hypothetical protein